MTSELRQLHLVGALGALRVERHEGREHLVVPVVALMEGVIHAVNAPSPEFVPLATLARMPSMWNGRPLVVGHPVRDGRQVSANEPGVLEACGFGKIFNARSEGTRLLMDAWIDPRRLEELGQARMLADIRAGRPIEVSVGAYVSTDSQNGVHNGKAYSGSWRDLVSDHLAFLPGGRGACSNEMGCGANRAASYLVTAEGFQVLGGPGSGPHKGGDSEAKKISEHATHLSNVADAGALNGPNFDSKAAHTAAAEAHKTAVSKADHVDAIYHNARIKYHEAKASGKKVIVAKNGSIIVLKESGVNAKFAELKKRVLALFDTPEQAASEEAAELVAYNAMRAQFDSIGDQWDAASGLIDDLIADEEENPTETPMQEQAEEEVEDARLDAIRMHCYTMMAALQSVCNACSEQQVSDVSDPRYMEELETLGGPGSGPHKGGSSGHEVKVTEIHADGPIRPQTHFEGKAGHFVVKENHSVHRMHADGSMTKVSSHANQERAKETAHNYAQGKRPTAWRGAIGKSISAKNLKTVQAAHDASHDMHTHTVSLGAECNGMKLLASKKDCPTCEGSGNKDGNPCEACDGAGELKTAETKAACRCEEADVNRTERIAALLKHEHNPIKDQKALEANSDEGLKLLEVHCENAATLKTAGEKLAANNADLAAKLKAAEAPKPVTIDQLPAEFKALVERAQKQESDRKDGLIAQLKGAQAEYTEDELKTLDLATLERTARLLKVDAPSVDFGGRVLPMPSRAASESYDAPDPFAAGLKTLREQTK